MNDINELYKIYQANIKVDDTPRTTDNNPIKVGDLVVAIYNNREIRGEVSAVYESYYLLKGKNSSLKVTLDDITEHYPKNRRFENKNVKKFTNIENSKINESVSPPPPPEQKTEEEKPIVKKKKIIEEFEDNEERNNPDNQVDLTTEHQSTDNIKTIGKVVYYKEIKYSQINDMFEKKLLSKETYWYLLTEKQEEIHVVRYNDRGFEIQPFVSALVGHFLKQNGKLNESFNQIKIKGNNNFSIISNIPQNVHKQLLNSLIGLLSGVKNN